jgi:hypothetical protein
MIMGRITAPADLGRQGRALLRRLDGWLAEQQLRLDPHEEVVLVEACRIADRLGQLRAALAEVDLAVEPGAVRLLAEERQQRSALAQLLITKLGLPTGLVDPGEAPAGGLSPQSRRGQKAAAARWRPDAS